MQSPATTVRQYLAELPPDRRAAITAIRKLIRQNLQPGFEEGMQYGMIGYYVPHKLYPPGYHCDPKQPLPYACLASQKNYMSLYMLWLYGESETAFRERWTQTGKKLDMGKSCIRFKKLDDLPLDLVAETVGKLSVPQFIAFYESALKNSRRGAGSQEKSARKTTTTASAGRKRAPQKKS